MGYFLINSNIAKKLLGFRDLNEPLRSALFSFHKMSLRSTAILKYANLYHFRNILLFFNIKLNQLFIS